MYGGYLFRHQLKAVLFTRAFGDCGLLGPLIILFVAATFVFIWILQFVYVCVIHLLES